MEPTEVTTRHIIHLLITTAALAVTGCATLPDGGDGPEGLTTYRLLQLDDGQVLAGTEGGLYVSDDGGRTWTLASPPVHVMDLQQSATEPQVWIAGTERDGILLSDDGGSTWRAATASPSSSPPSSIRYPTCC